MLLVVVMFMSLKVAQSLLEENQYGLVIGSEQLSSIVDYQDRNTCIFIWRWCSRYAD